jgi:ABC-type dipeptide/oligopeptide/nickel transport system permease component
MSQYVLRRLLIAVPSLLGISLVLFIVLALAPGDPFSELATNPNVPPEVAAALRASSASTIRSICVTCTGSRPCCGATGAFPLSAG